MLYMKNPAAVITTAAVLKKSSIKNITFFQYVRPQPALVLPHIERPDGFNVFVL